MKIIYFSAVSKKHFELLNRLNIKIDYLKSYFELQSKTELALDLTVNNFFLDSGAYSARTKGKEIDLQKFIEFIKNNKEQITVYAGLDVIGDPHGTYKNIRIMERAGLQPIPTFHFGSEIRVIEYWCQNYDYVALGGMAGLGTSAKDLDIWLYQTFKKFPDQKFHGFGITNIDLLKVYPWHSVDSTTYLNGSKFGNIIYEDKQIHYQKLHGFGPDWPLLSEFLDKSGATYDDFINTGQIRDVFNIIQIQKFGQKHMAEKLNQTILPLY